MEGFPEMYISFPNKKEAELLNEMRNFAEHLWRWQAHDPHGEPPEEGYFYFHRSAASRQYPEKLSRLPDTAPINSCRSRSTGVIFRTMVVTPFWPPDAGRKP
ncbi:MAG: hypothetical protein HYR83_09355 [Planctomycetes bacterium]|nr:hypothetical protein [Planctomycetota bacterium]